MAPKFVKGQTVVFQAADDKYKGTVESVNAPKEGSYYDYDLKLTHKLGLLTSTYIPTL